MNAEWSQIKIKKNEKDGEGLRLMEIETTPDVCSLYKLPGQYVQIRAAADAKPGFYAICNAPKSSSSSFSFLIKDVENNSFLTNAKEGETLEMSIPMGKGFQTQEYFEKYKFDYATTQVIMMACGSGIAPIAAAIESETLGLMKKNYNALYERKGLLYIGARTEAHLPLQHKYKDWSELGMTIIPVLSQPSSDWTGRTGYIQDVLKKDKISIPKNSGALLCGPRGMTDAARELFLEAGVFEGRILLNF
eukprot:CAMPEP_0182423814 /NCGR_PEP_ID=MMETSP1167-20130531/9885_1 /TAXON_ID=2988 /ORGANISM="Mallomonas Sp, Strain CCMP3275" /LENGTH=247 /DNA_ID=CAMNT_0024603099 /DNA_START=134 /DNA_END=877 /DNA_ORIENTATION=-